jgi:hypothetical protein
MKPDELFRKYQADGWIGPSSFTAALKEYGELVKAEAVKVCKGEADATHYYFSQVREGINDCAAAIEKMELP